MGRKIGYCLWECTVGVSFEAMASLLTLSKNLIPLGNVNYELKCSYIDIGPKYTCIDSLRWIFFYSVHFFTFEASASLLIILRVYRQFWRTWPGSESSMMMVGFLWNTGQCAPFLLPWLAACLNSQIACCVKIHIPNDLEALLVSHSIWLILCAVWCLCHSEE